MWLPTNVINRNINVFRTYSIFTGLLIHQTSNFNFYKYLMIHSPGQCFQQSAIGCLKAYMKPSDFDHAYHDYYG